MTTLVRCFIVFYSLFFSFLSFVLKSLFQFTWLRSPDLDTCKLEMLMACRYGRTHMKVLKDTKHVDNIQSTNSQFWTVAQFDERIMCRMMGLSSAKVP